MEEITQRIIESLLTFITGILVGYVIVPKVFVTNKQKDSEALELKFRKGEEVTEMDLSCVNDHDNDNNNDDNLVVKFTTPDELYKKLPFLKLEHVTDVNENRNVNLDYYFQCMRQYSVNTNHKYFLNQLFGPSDEVCVRAEHVLANLNTSAYTYETAPVLTLVEHEVVRYFLRMLDEGLNKGCGGVYWNLNGDGIFVPGGSLSNLMALHVAAWRYRNFENGSGQELTAFVSSEAHYSYQKAANIMNVKLVPVEVDLYGRMNVDALRRAMKEHSDVFFVGATSGSTVKGAFDDLKRIGEVISDFCVESMSNSEHGRNKIWFHCDGAWGGNAIFSSTHCNLLEGLSQYCDSFTLNAHKMLGAPQQCTIFLTKHASILRDANSLRASYLFSKDKFGAAYDLGDKTFTCGRRGDALKYWALIKQYGAASLGRRIDHNACMMLEFAKAIENSQYFVLACPPNPFNVNFFFISSRLRHFVQKEASYVITSEGHRILDFAKLDEKILGMLHQSQMDLKLSLHASGSVLIPHQPIYKIPSSQQNIHCLRFVLAGSRLTFDKRDISELLTIISSHGNVL